MPGWTLVQFYGKKKHSNFPWSTVFQAWDVSLLLLDILLSIFVRARQRISQPFQLPTPPKLTPGLLHLALPQSLRGQLPQHLPRGLLDFAFLSYRQPCMAVLPRSKCTSQDSLIGSSSPGKQGPLIQEVCPLACLKLCWLQLPGCYCLSGGFCYCSPSNWPLTWDHQFASQKGFTNKPMGRINLLYIISEKDQLSKPINYIKRGLVH